MEPINLGKRFSPVGYAATPEALSDSVNFPSVYLDDLPVDTVIPKSGTITFRYALNKITEEVKDGEKCFSVDLLQVLEVKSAPAAKVASEGAAALDKYAASKNGDGESSDDGPNREDYVA